jgi:tetratricopeptide (TPR) repeat protein
MTVKCMGAQIIMAGAFAALALATGWSLRMAWSDYQASKQTQAGLEEAIRWMPGRAEYHYRLAMLLEETDPARSTRALERVITLNPSDANAWIHLGLRHEIDGRYAQSEECLLRAAAVNLEFLPRWTLANFYLRREKFPQFWDWSRSAAQMAYGNPAALFQLCERISPDANLIDRLAIRRPEIQAAYLRHLLDDALLDRVPAAVRSLMEAPRTVDTPLLMEACNRLLDFGRVQDALDLWNDMVRAKLIRFATLDPGGGNTLTNGRFTSPPSSRGFDWRLPDIAGVTASGEWNPGGLRLTFSGSQPEDCEVLAQLAPVRDSAPYDLRFSYDSSGMPAASGLAWRIADARTGATLAQSEYLHTGNELRAAVHFATPPSIRMIRLSLHYRRTPGTIRIAGYVVLREVGLWTADHSAGEAELRSRVR